MDRSSFYKLKMVATVWVGFFLSAGLFSAQANAQGKSKKKPNIIFIMSDDHAYQAISAYDPTLIKTPNIDRIAKEGALMERAYVTNSICGPSRAAILTGKYSHINGFKGNRDTFNSKQQTFPHLLQANGYRTAIVGKWHLESEPNGFDHWNILPGQGYYYNPNFIKMGKDTTYQGYVTDVTTDLALNWLEGNKDKPFLLMVHQKAPHRNQMPPLENLGLFNDRTFAMPANFYSDYQNQLALQRQRTSMINDLEIDHDSKVPCPDCPPRNGWKFNKRAYQREVGRLTPEQKEVWQKAYQKEYEAFANIKTKEELIKWQYQRYMEDYLRCIKSVDDNVGRLLAYLEKNGLAENTIVIYTSDQGAYLGEHGLYDKRFMYEESFRTPMMVRYPAAIKPGQKISQFAMNIDVAPTVLDFAGITVPQDIQGASMKNLLTGQKAKNWRENMYYHYYDVAFGVTAHYGIRNNRYKLIRFYNPIESWELYDLQKDPREMNNVYADPAYSKVVASLHKDLDAARLKYKDTTPASN